MPPDELFAAVHRRPFEAFRIYLSDGSVFEIRHPDMIMPGRRAFVVGLPGVPNQPHDRFVTVALLHVTRLEPFEVTSSSGNGNQG